MCVVCICVYMYLCVYVCFGVCVGSVISLISVAVIKSILEKEGFFFFFGLHLQVTIHHWGKMGQELQRRTVEEWVLLSGSFSAGFWIQLRTTCPGNITSRGGLSSIHEAIKTALLRPAHRPTPWSWWLKDSSFQVTLAVPTWQLQPLRTDRPAGRQTLGICWKLTFVWGT